MSFYDLRPIKENLSYVYTPEIISFASSSFRAFSSGFLILFLHVPQSCFLIVSIVGKLVYVSRVRTFSGFLVIRVVIIECKSLSDSVGIRFLTVNGKLFLRKYSNSMVFQVLCKVFAECHVNIAVSKFVSNKNKHFIDFSLPTLRNFAKAISGLWRFVF